MCPRPLLDRLARRLLVLTTVLSAGPALGQPAARPPEAEANAPALTPPSLASEAIVEYPEGATGDHEVVLELVVDDAGRVREARAILGEAPFTSAAEAAARTWTFQPARRGAQPVAARIHFRLTFREPEPDPAEAPPDAPAGVDAAEAQADVPAGATPEGAAQRRAPVQPTISEPLEVTVEGDRPEVPRTATLSRAEVRQLPGAFGDPFRAIEMLPGVTPLISGVPYFFVRGAPPGNVGYFLDGIRVPYLFHLGLGPSVVHPGLVERVDLYSGAYPARYGRFAGAIVAGETTPPSYRLRLEGTARIVDTGVLAEDSFFDDSTTILVGGRYSYTALLISLLSQEVDLQYWDYQARVTHALDGRNQLGVFAFGAFDRLADTSGREDETLFSVQFHRLDLRWGHEPSARTRVDTALTLGIDRTGLGGDDTLAILDRMIAGRSTVKHRAEKQTLVRAGVDVLSDFYSVDVSIDRSRADGDSTTEAEVNEAFPTRADVALGLWSDVVHDYDPGWSVTPGARIDLYYSDRVLAYAIEPRISSTHHVTDAFRIVNTFGLAHQPPSFVIPIPGFAFSALDDGLQQSIQTSSGVEVDLPKEYSASVTLFQSAFFEMTDVLGAGVEDEDLLNRSTGVTRGVEVAIKRPLNRRFGGFLSYTLSRSTRSIGRETFPATFDRTHVLSAAAAYDLGKRWRLGGRLMFYTGTPTYPDLDSANAVTGVFGGDIGNTLRSSDVGRLSPFHRIDVRLEKQWRLGETGYWAFVLEMLNATLRKEPVGLNCNPGGDCTEERIGPVAIPSIGVEVVY